MSYGRTMHKLFHEQAVSRRVAKWKKASLTDVGNLLLAGSKPKFSRLKKSEPKKDQ